MDHTIIKGILQLISNNDNENIKSAILPWIFQ